MHNTPHTIESKEKMSKALTGKKYPNRKKPDIAPIPPNHSGKKWWNNGTENKRSVECPGEDFKKGRIRYSKTVEMRRGFLRARLESWAKRNKERVGFCEWCYSTDNLEAHHILPKKKFPQYFDEDSNCRVMCHSCHVNCHMQGGC